jgi:hypothetical protein
MLARSSDEQTILFNLREFEQMIKSALTKAGYKPPAIARVRAIKEDMLVMQMAEHDLSRAC